MKIKFILINIFAYLVLSAISCKQPFHMDDHRGYYPDSDNKEHHYKDKRHTYVPQHAERPMVSNIPISRRKKKSSTELLKASTKPETSATKKEETITEAPKDVPKENTERDVPPEPPKEEPK